MLEVSLERLRERAAPDAYAVFRLVAVEGRPVAEVASAFGLRRNHVSVVKCRMLGRLRAIAEEVVRGRGGE